MATMITSECINCGACEPECPNTAIYQGGVEWELNGVTHPPISGEIFYIVPEKCTECVGFFDHEACAAVCPVDCCIPNPDIPETESVLIARAKELHPEQEFGDSFPSRFGGGGGGEAPAESGPAAATPAPAASAPAASAPAASAPAAPAAPPPAAAAAVGARVERPLSAPRPQLKLVSAPARKEPYAGELALSFEDAQASLGGPRSTALFPVKLATALGMPLLGALPNGIKRRLEGAIGDKRFFTASGATGLNALHNFLFYPVMLVVIGAVVFGRDVFSEQLKGLIFLGVLLASLEAMWRMKEGFSGAPAEQITLRPSFYGLPLAPLGSILLRLAGGGARNETGTVAVDGFHSPEFEDKMERERRYGEVYRVEECQKGYLVTMELPRRVPPSAQKLSQGIPDEMPDYQLDVGVESGFLVVRGKVLDTNLRKAAAVSPAFPPDFTTQIRLGRAVRGFKHRYQDKTLEVALLC